VVTVRQSDAHAWAEIWLAGRGWLRVDPTAAVAPERVQRSLARALPRHNPFGIEALGELMLFGEDRNSIMAQLRFELSAMDNGWNQWVLNYTPQRQRGVLDSVRSGALNWRTLAVAAAGLLLVWGAYAMRERQRRNPVDALYSALCLQLGRLGIARAADEGPNAYRERIDIAHLAPQHKHAAARFLRLYSAYKYGAQPSDPGLAATLKNLLTKFR
jgi:hypothetical protein